MCIVWNNILDRVNKALQAPGIEIGSVVMHYRVLLEHIHSLRDSERFDRFENEAKSVAPGLDYDDENKRAKKRKLFQRNTRRCKSERLSRELPSEQLPSHH